GGYAVVRHADEGARLDLHLLDEPAAEFEVTHLLVLPDRRRPLNPVVDIVPEGVGPLFRVACLLAMRLGPHGLDLEADERGPVRLAVFVQPVGVDQPRGVVVRVVQDRPQQRVAVAHHIPYPVTCAFGNILQPPCITFGFSSAASNPSPGGPVAGPGPSRRAPSAPPASGRSRGRSVAAAPGRRRRPSL